MNKMTKQQMPLLPPNGDLRCVSIKKENNEEQQQLIRTRIDELEQELNRLRLQLSISDNI
jgi:SMC interacting uncharacterized protein involved in chromosome segregation